MSSEAEKIAQFKGLTGAPEPIARSILEAANWDLEVAPPTSDSSNFADCCRNFL